MNQNNEEKTYEEPSLEQMIATIMIEFICKRPELIEDFKILFKERMDAYKNDKLDAVKYLLEIAQLVDQKLE